MMKTKKKIAGLSKIIRTREMYRVIRADRRANNFVSSWSILYLCARVSEISGEAAVPSRDVIPGFVFRLYPNAGALYTGKRDLICLRRVAFENRSRCRKFLWNLFASKSCVTQPYMCTYTGAWLNVTPQKSTITVKYSKLLDYLLPRLSEFSARVTAYTYGGVTNINRDYLTYLYYFDAWFFLNIANWRSFSFSPTFLAWHWVSPFLPFFDFSPKPSFSFFDNFTPLYPFFFTFRGGKNLVKSVSSLISLTKSLFFTTDYVDWVPYEGREGFNFWTFSSEQAYFVRTSAVDSARGLKFELVPLDVMAEPDLGDSENSRIPYHFYFNEVDFLQALLETEKTSGGEDRMFSYIRFFAPIFLFIELFLLRLFWAPQLVGFLYFLWDRSRLKLIDRAHSLNSIKLINSWVYTKIFLNGLGGCRILWSRKFSGIFFVTYNYNNTIRPVYLAAFLIFFMLREAVAMLHATILMDCQFFKNAKFYFFSIKRLKFYFFRQKLINALNCGLFLFICRDTCWFWLTVIKSLIRMTLAHNASYTRFVRRGVLFRKLFFCLSFVGVGCVWLFWIFLSTLNSFWVIAAVVFLGLFGVGGAWGGSFRFGFRKAKEEETLLVRLYFNRQKLFVSEHLRVLRRILFSGLSFILCYRLTYWIYAGVVIKSSQFCSAAILKCIGYSAAKFNFRKLCWSSLLDCITSLFGRLGVKNFYNQLYGAGAVTGWGAFNVTRFFYGWYGWWRTSSHVFLPEFTRIRVFNRLPHAFMYSVLIASYIDGGGVVRRFSNIKNSVLRLESWVNNSTLVYFYGSIVNLLNAVYKSKKKDCAYVASDSMLLPNAHAIRFFLAKLGAGNVEFMKINARGLVALISILCCNSVRSFVAIAGDVLRVVLYLLNCIYWVGVAGSCLMGGLLLTLIALSAVSSLSAVLWLYLLATVYYVIKFLFMCFVIRIF